MHNLHNILSDAAAMKNIVTALLITVAILVIYEFRKRFTTIFGIDVDAALTVLQLIFGFVGTAILHFSEYIFEDAAILGV